VFRPITSTWIGRPGACPTPDWPPLFRQP